MTIPAPGRLDLLPEDIPLSVAYEDDDLLVVDKAAGMTVHPAPGMPDGNPGERPSPPLPRSVRDQRGPAARHRTPPRPRHHRPDGRRQERPRPPPPRRPARGADPQPGLRRRRLGRSGRRPDRSRHRPQSPGPVADGGSRRWAPRRHPFHDLRTARFPEPASRRAGNRQNPTRSACICSTPAIPYSADPVYGGRSRLRGIAPEHRGAASRALELIGRQALHASRLAFEHPSTGKAASFSSPLPEDIGRVLELLRRPA